MIIVRAPSPSFSLHGRWISVVPLSRDSACLSDQTPVTLKIPPTGPDVSRILEIYWHVALPSRRLRHELARWGYAPPVAPWTALADPLENIETEKPRELSI